jgi:hypothetical protein
MVEACQISEFKQLELKKFRLLMLTSLYRNFQMDIRLVLEMVESRSPADNGRDSLLREH